MYTNDSPNPDILIRTGNTKRLSNFLLWQIAYTEIFFEKNLWPEFSTNDYNRILRKDLDKPRYLSMGSIAAREGFKMPQGKENIRTHNLGNSAPKLLKFKAEGVNHDNTQ